MPKRMTQEQVMQRLKLLANAQGSQRALAQQIGVSESFLSEVLRGTREPTGYILSHLGLRKIVEYEASTGGKA